MREALRQRSILLVRLVAGLTFASLPVNGQARVGPVGSDLGGLVFNSRAPFVLLASTETKSDSDATGNAGSDHPVDQSHVQPVMVPASREGMDLRRWPAGQFYESLSERIETLSRTHGDERTAVFLDITELYLGQMLTNEAESVLQDLMPKRALDVSRHQTLSDAVQLLVGKSLPDDSLSLLFDLDRNDRELWVVLDAINQADVATLNDNLAASLIALGRQSRPVASAVLPIITEAMIELQKFDLAKQSLQLIEANPNLAGKPVVHYLRARASELAGDEATALLAYFKTSEGWDQYAVRGRIALADMALKNNSRGALLAARDVLKYNENAWRGDSYEVQVLDRLGRLNADLGEPVLALKAYGKLTMRFPRAPAAEAAVVEAQRLLADIYTMGAQGEIPLAEWMSVHFQLVPSFRYYPVFAEYTVVLADYVLSLGGTELAVEEYRRALALKKELQGIRGHAVLDEELAGIQFKVAVAQSRGGKAQQALETLQSIPPVENAEFRQKIIALKAEMLADLGDSEGLRKTYVSAPSARNLRDVAHALWQDQSWPEAITFYQRLWAEFPGQFSATDASYLLIAAHHASDDATANSVVSAFPGMTSSQDWVDLAKGMTEAKSSLQPLSLEAAENRLDSLERSLRFVKDTAASLEDSDL